MKFIKNVLKIIILILAAIGFKTIGGVEFIERFIDLDAIFKKPSQEKLQEKAAKIADLSNINQEYTIKKNINILGVKAILSEHNATGQKFIIANDTNNKVIKKEDFQSNEIDTKIKNLADKIQYQFIRLEDVKITQRGNINAFNQSVPYVKFSADAVNLPISDIQGIIGAAEINGKTKIIISINEGKKYSQIISQEFFKDVK